MKQPRSPERVSRASQEVSATPKEESASFRDCTDILRSGAKDNGVYTIRLPNSTQPVKVL